MEQQDRPYSREEILALEQTRGFSYTPEEIGLWYRRQKIFSFPYHELSMLPGPTQAGSVDVLPSYEEMTVDELFNGPNSLETQPDLEQVQALDEGTAVINGCTVKQIQPADPEKMQLE